MRADIRTSRIVLRAAIAIVTTLMFATLSTGCRTIRVGGAVDPDSALTSLVASAEAAEVAALPDGPARLLVTERCLTCHSAGLIARQRKDAAAWGRTLTQMRAWGTPIQDDDQAALVAYLSEHFGPGSARR